MSQATIKICDTCGKEYDSRKCYHWSDCVGKVVISFKDHAGVQSVIEHELCTNCALKLRGEVTRVLSELKPKEATNENTCEG